MNDKTNSKLNISVEEKHVLLRNFLKLSIAKEAVDSIPSSEDNNDYWYSSRCIGKLVVFQNISMLNDNIIKICSMNEDDYSSFMDKEFKYKFCVPTYMENEDSIKSFKNGVKDAINDIYKLLFSYAFEPLGELESHGQRIVNELGDCHKAVVKYSKHADEQWQ